MYRRLLIEGRGTKAIARTFRVWKENVFPMTRHSSDLEDATESEDDRAERQRKARDGAQPVHNILADIEDSSSDDGFGSGTPDAGDNAAAHPNRKGKGVDRDATFTMENLSLSIAPTRPATPASESGDDIRASHHAVHGGETMLEEEFQVDPYHVAHADLRNILNKSFPPQASTSQPRSRASMRRPVIVSARQAQVSHSTASAPVAAALPVTPPVVAASAQPVVPPVAPPVMATPAQPIVVGPAPRRTSNRGKAAAGTSEIGNGQAAGPSNAAAPGRGSKAGKKSQGA